MQVWLERVQPWLAYPSTMVLCLLLCAALLAGGAAPAISAYVPALIGAALVTGLELRFPHERAWRPTRGDVRQDLWFMIAVQMVLPKLLALGVALLAVDAVGRAAPLAAYWPHHLPVWAQAALMLLGAEFLRYWLHVAAHRRPLLWRLHAVHHSPERLYWLNVGRFHPLEKSLQFLLDTLPFVMLGVGPAVIALYFVFYAVNGFFQHSNIRLRYGLLNLLVSSAELHRWHHSRLPSESNHNYGNNLIVWDLVFGTWFLPRDRKVGELGLTNRRYPRRFLEQMLTPFTPAMTDRPVPLRSVGALAEAVDLWLRMQLVRVARWWPLRLAAWSPRLSQAWLLRRLLHRARHTHFGAAHGFARIRSPADYAAGVPLQDYETLRPYMSAQETGEPALTLDQPFMLAVTSGTTGEPKFLPISHRTVNQYRRGQQLYAFLLYRFCPQAFAGRAFGVVSPAVEGHRSSGLPYGSVSGHLYATMPRAVRRRYVVPPAVYAIDDASLKYRVMLRLALAAPDISYVAGANPSSFLRLLDELDTARDALAASLESGDLAPLGSVPDEVATVLRGRIGPEPERAAQLRGLDHSQRPRFSGLWPEIRLVAVWTGGSCGTALAALRTTLPSQSRVVELGYLASELRATLTIDADTGAGLPLLTQHYFEFIERMDYEAGRTRVRLLHELEMEHDYYVIVTTASGLYRYFMNDIVRVVGRCGATPTLRFVQKGRGVTSITGEKLYEHQVLQAVAEAGTVHGFVPVFVMALADETAPGYRVFLESGTSPPGAAHGLAQWLDARLGELNLEYRSKRDSGRLVPLELHRLADGAGEAYKAHCVGAGQREGQFKTIALQSAAAFDFPIEQYVMRDA